MSYYEVTNEDGRIRRISTAARTKNLAEELYEIAAEFHSVENQVRHIKDEAREAAREGQFSLYLEIEDFSPSDQEKAYELLRSDGFTIKDNYLRWGKE